MVGWVERVNAEAHYNSVTAMDAGLQLPRIKILNSNDEIDAALKDPSCYVESGMAIEKIHGPEVTFHAFYQDHEFSCRTISINDTNLLAGGQGPDIGDNVTTIFCGRSKQIIDGIDQEPIEKAMEKLIDLAIKQEGEYSGFVNITVTYRDGIPYYKNVLYGYTLKYMAGLLSLYEGDISTFFMDPACREVRLSSVKGFGVTLRLWAYPYDEEHNRSIGEGIPGLEWDGESWIAVGRGDTIKDTWRDLYSTLAPLVNRGVCFRTDGEIKARRVFNEIMKRQLVKRS